MLRVSSMLLSAIPSNFVAPSAGMPPRDPFSSSWRRFFPWFNLVRVAGGFLPLANPVLFSDFRGARMISFVVVFAGRLPCRAEIFFMIAGWIF